MINMNNTDPGTAVTMSSHVGLHALDFNGKATKLRNDTTLLGVTPFHLSNLK